MRKLKILILTILIALLSTTFVFANTVTIDTTTKSGKIYEYYVDTEGNKLKSSTSTTINNNEYSKTALTIDGYVCINARVNEDLLYSPSTQDLGNKITVNLSNFSEDGDYVIFIYDVDSDNSGYPDDPIIKEDVTIKYYDYSTGKQLDSESTKEYIGDNYKLTPSTNKTFSGDKYTFVSATPSVDDNNRINIFVSSDDSDNIIKLYYRKGLSTSRYITVKQIDIDTDKVIDEDIIPDIKVGTKYSYYVESVSGYNFISSTPSSTGTNNVISLTVKEDNDDNIIYCYYRKSYSDSNLNNWYNSTNQYYVSPTDTYFNYYNTSSYVNTNTSTSTSSNTSTNTSTNTNNNTSTKTTVSNTGLSEKGLAINKNEYYSFINGYSDGSFKPDQFITRAEAASALYSICEDKTNGSLTYNFKDLKTTDWYYKPIYFLCSNGIMTGYGDQTVRPNSYISRAEFTVMAMKIVGYNNTDTIITFSDVRTGDWYYNYIRAGVNASLISGYSDNTFRPNNNITRAEATKIIDNIIGRTIDKQNNYKEIYYSDVPYTLWSYPYIKMASGQQK